MADKEEGLVGRSGGCDSAFAFVDGMLLPPADAETAEVAIVSSDISQASSATPEDSLAVPPLSHGFGGDWEAIHRALPLW